MNEPVHPPVRQSVRHIFFTKLHSSLYHEIFNYFHWLKWCPCKSQGQKSKLKVTDVKTYFVPIWEFPDRNSSSNWQMATEWCRKLEVVKKRCPIVFQGHASNFKVKLTQIERFWTGTPIWIHRWLWNDTQTLECFKIVSHCISGSSAKFLGDTGRKIDDDTQLIFLWQIWRTQTHTELRARSKWNAIGRMKIKKKTKKKTTLNKTLKYATLWWLINPCNKSQETHPDVHITMWCYQSSKHIY